MITVPRAATVEIHVPLGSSQQQGGGGWRVPWAAVSAVGVWIARLVSSVVR